MCLYGYFKATWKIWRLTEHADGISKIARRRLLVRIVGHLNSRSDGFLRARTLLTVWIFNTHSNLPSKIILKQYSYSGVIVSREMYKYLRVAGRRRGSEQRDWFAYPWHRHIFLRLRMRTRAICRSYDNFHSPLIWSKNLWLNRNKNSDKLDNLLIPNGSMLIISMCILFRSIELPVQEQIVFFVCLFSGIILNT